MSFTVRSVTFKVLGEMVNRPESRIRRLVASENISHWGNYVKLANAVRIALGMRRYTVRKKRRVKFRLALPTLLLAQRYRIEHKCSAETLYRLAAEGLMLQVRDTNLIDYSKPGPALRGLQVDLRAFDPYTYNAMKIAAWAFRTKPSAIMDWALHQFFVTELPAPSGEPERAPSP